MEEGNMYIHVLAGVSGVSYYIYIYIPLGIMGINHHWVLVYRATRKRSTVQNLGVWRET